MCALSGSDVGIRVRDAIRGKGPGWLIPAVAHAAGTTPRGVWQALSQDERLAYYQRMVRDEVPYYLHMTSRDLIVRLGMPAHVAHRARQEVALKYGLDLQNENGLKGFVPPPKSGLESDFRSLFKHHKASILPNSDLDDMVGALVQTNVEYGPGGVYLITGYGEDTGEQRMFLMHLDTGELILVPHGTMTPLGKIMMGDYQRTVDELRREMRVVTEFRWVPVPTFRFKMAKASTVSHVLKPGKKIMIR